MVKSRPAHAGDLRDAGSIPGWERCPGGGHGNPLQYPSLENPMDKRRLVGYRVRHEPCDFTQYRGCNADPPSSVAQN